MALKCTLSNRKLIDISKSSLPDPLKSKKISV